MPFLPHRNLSRAVLIGTSDFEHSDRLPGLPAVRQNLTELSAALTNSDTGIVDWEQCVLIDTPDSPASFMGRLRKGARQAEDMLLVYYAGHGVRHDKRDDLYLTVRQSDPDELDGTAVPFAWVRDAIEHSPAKTRLLILDCCYSGMALGSMSSNTIDAREVQISGTSVITSSPKNKISHSPPGERLTAFTGELISLLANGPRVADEPLTVHALYRGLVAAMANRQFPVPKMKAGDLSGDLLLRRPPVSWEQPSSDEPIARASYTTVRESPETVPLITASPGHSSQPNPPPPQRVERSHPRKEHPPALPVPRPEQSLEKKPAAVRAAIPFGWLLLWIVLAFFLDMAVGGVVGFFFGTPPGGASSTSDLNTALAMAVVAAICVVAVWRRAANKSREDRQVTIVGDLRDTLAASLARLPTTILAILAILFLTFAIVGSFSGNAQPLPGSTISSLSVAVAMVLWLTQLAAGCTYAILRRRARS